MPTKHREFRDGDIEEEIREAFQVEVHASSSSFFYILKYNVEQLNFGQDFVHFFQPEVVVEMLGMMMKLLKGMMITENDNDDYPRFLTEMGTDGLTHQSFKRCLTVGRLRLIIRKKIEYICLSSVLAAFYLWAK